MALGGGLLVKSFPWKERERCLQKILNLADRLKG